MKHEVIYFVLSLFHLMVPNILSFFKIFIFSLVFDCKFPLSCFFMIIPDWTVLDWGALCFLPCTHQLSMYCYMFFTVIFSLCKVKYFTFPQIPFLYFSNTLNLFDSQIGFNRGSTFGSCTCIIFTISNSNIFIVDFPVTTTSQNQKMLCNLHFCKVMKIFIVWVIY